MTHGRRGLRARVVALLLLAASLFLPAAASAFIPTEDHAPHLQFGGGLSENSRLGFETRKPRLVLAPLGPQLEARLGDTWDVAGEWRQTTDDFRNRWYDADLGRWLSRDPAGYPDGPNQYAAFLGNPVGFADPSGLVTHVSASISRYDVLGTVNDETGNAALDHSLVMVKNDVTNTAFGLVNIAVGLQEGLIDVVDAGGAWLGLTRQGDVRELVDGFELSLMSGALGPPGELASLARLRGAMWGQVGTDLRAAFGNAATLFEEASLTRRPASVRRFGPGAAHIDDPAFGKIDYPLRKPAGVSEEAWQKKLDALNRAAAEGRARVVHRPSRSGSAQRQARQQGLIESGHDADHGLDLQFGGADTLDEIVSTPKRVNRSVGGQGRHRKLHADGTPIRRFVDEQER